MILMAACKLPDQKQDESVGQDILEGIWYAELLNTDKKPSISFELHFDRSENDLITYFVNSEERIPQQMVYLADDSVRIKSLYFDSWIDLKITDTLLSGVWFNRYRSPDYRMPFKATRDKFKVDNQLNTYDVKGKWRVVFSPDSESPEDAIGMFNAEESPNITGTFLTETGDYRYLTGYFSNNRLSLSTFDGSHAYHFSAFSENGDTIYGKFYSGNHYEANWIAWRDDSFELRDPYELTGVHDPEQPLDLSFTDIEGKTVRLSDTPYISNPVIVQLIGSWCPNCLDETRYLQSIYKDINKMGVQVVSLAFEAADSARAIDLLRQYQLNLGIEWKILYAGNSRKSEAIKRLPRLEHIYSFPTTIYLRRDHTVMSVYTGFYGPGTGDKFNQQSLKMRKTIKGLVDK